MNVTMVVPRQSWHLVTLTLYSAVVVFVALTLAWPLPLGLLLLCGLPIVLFIWETELPLARLLVGVGILATIAMVLEAVAHQTGMWYTLTSSPGQLIGLTPQSLLFAFVHTLYLLVLYEYLFDDARVPSLQVKRLRIFAAFFAAAVVTTFYLFSVWVVSFAFLWVLLLLGVAILGLMWLAHPGNSVGLLHKAGFFGLMVFPLSLLFELVAIAHGVRIFAFTSEYVAVVSLFGQVVPLEEVILLLLWPALLIFLYECFIDNGR